MIPLQAWTHTEEERSRYYSPRKALRLAARYKLYSIFRALMLRGMTVYIIPQ